MLGIYFKAINYYAFNVIAILHIRYHFVGEDFITFFPFKSVSCLSKSLRIIYRDENVVKNVAGYFTLPQIRGKADIHLTWLYLENMLLKAVGSYTNPQYASASQLAIFYKNPEKEFKDLETGGNVKIDELWE